MKLNHIFYDARYYSEAYKTIATITQDRQRITEVKIVAEYINFKVHPTSVVT